MVAAIIQARLGSSRLPNKVFAEICGQKLIWHIIERIKKSKKVKKIILATSINPKDDTLYSWAVSNDILTFRGSEENVLKRFYDAALFYHVDTIVRITADDPLKDPFIIDKVVELYENERCDVCTNNNPPTYPEGLDVEVFSFDALNQAYKESIDIFEKEHVTQYFYKNPDKFKILNLSHHTNLSNYRWTIDTELDLDFARKVYDWLYKKEKIFLFQDILNLLEQEPALKDINKSVPRSTMYNK